MKEGDIICELYGGDLLYVLRYDDGGEVAKLIGIAYVHGLMNGEALTAPDRIEDIYFTIRLMVGRNGSSAMMI